MRVAERSEGRKNRRVPLHSLEAGQGGLDEGHLDIVLPRSSYVGEKSGHVMVVRLYADFDDDSPMVCAVPEEALVEPVDVDLLWSRRNV